MQASHYYVPDVNAGSDEEPDLPAVIAAAAAGAAPGDSSSAPDAGPNGGQQPSGAEEQQAAMRSPFAKGRAALRIAAAQALGSKGWTELVSKLETIFERVGVQPAVMYP